MGFGFSQFPLAYYQSVYLVLAKVEVTAYMAIQALQIVNVGAGSKSLAGSLDFE
ncbi:Uncharacterised protein [Acinetobacter baumannii]|nr:Uncharacterised protein [Acinetobacter baumannii]